MPCHVLMQGEITYNGQALPSACSSGGLFGGRGAFDVASVAQYVGQLDDHEPFLTVRDEDLPLRVCGFYIS